MSLILDTHAFLWWLDGDPRLSPRARSAIADPKQEVYVSAASAWEIATKFRLGKLPGAAAVAHDIPGCVRDQAFSELPISLLDATRAGALAGEHRDPFDRMLIAQALDRDWTLVSIEALFDSFGVRRLW
jgi:PIN domain nuclease of toxin-antitoxin system